MSRAAIYLLIATVLFSGHNIGVKWLSHMPTVQIVFMRAIISLIICVGTLKYLGVPLVGNNKKFLWLRGVFGTMALFGFFYCLQRMPLGVATILINLSPIFTVLIAHFTLNEKAHPLQGLLFLGAFSGVVLIKGWSFDVSWTLTMLGVGVAFVAGCAYTCVRVLKDTDHPLVVILYFPLVTVPIMIVPTIKYWQPPTPIEWGILIGIGLLTQFAQYFMTMAYQMERASSVMIFNYAGIIWAIIAGMFLFNEIPNLYQMLGMGMILLCLILSSVVKNLKERGLLSKEPLLKDD